MKKTGSLSRWRLSASVPRSPFGLPPVPPAPRFRLLSAALLAIVAAANGTQATSTMSVTGGDGQPESGAPLTGAPASDEQATHAARGFPTGSGAGVASDPMVGTSASDDRAPNAGALRILSVNLCVDQMLAYLAPDNLISVTWLSHGPADLAVRDVLDRIPANHAQIEEILRLKPDRIIGGEYGAPGLQAMLPRFGLTLQQLPLAEDFQTLYANWRLLGGWSGSSTTAKAIVQQLDTGLAGIRDELKGLRIKAVIINPNGWVAGSGSFQDAFLTHIGLRNLAAEDGLRGWGEVNLEALIRRPPDLIIVPQTHYQGAARATQWMDHPALERIGQGYPLLRLDAEQLACGTPDLLTAAARVRDHLRAKPARLPNP